jgi:Amidase
MDLCATPAVELARLIRARELSPAELLAAVLARIEAANPAINAIVTLAAEQASVVAAGLDAQAARGSFAGPLHGLPIAVKDLAETAGITTTFGSPLFASFVPGFDAPHVARLKQAGAVVIGKTNTPEFGAGSQTFNPVSGPTRNPHDTRLTPGRQQRRGRRGGSGRPDPVRGRFRPRGQRAEPGVLLWRGGPADHAGPGARRPVRPAGRGGPDRPHRAGRRAPAGRDVRDRSPAAPGPARTARGFPRPAARVAAAIMELAAPA